nr:aspartate--tRNA ligase, chloroplastic/mitochondrial [Tanacetum cinerariifolium]
RHTSSTAPFFYILHTKLNGCGPPSRSNFATIWPVPHKAFPPKHSQPAQQAYLRNLFNLLQSAMLRTHTNGELRQENVGQTVTLVGWVQRTRDKGGILWIDLRDRYGITQLALEEGVESDEVREQARTLGREFVISITGKVAERYSKNANIPTGDIEIVKCFRDEDLRADRQPEFTQIDCEMAFVEQEDILNTFEGLVRYLFKEIKNLDFPTVPRMEYADAM